MADEQSLDEAFFKAGTSFDRPIPGQSLTSDPDSPKPFEGPPKFTDRTAVLEHYFSVFTEENTYESMLDALDSGMSLMELTQVFLMEGFQKGLFNPDMMLMVAEPIAYMIAALAERADVDFTVMNDEDERPTGKDQEMSIMDQQLKTIEKPEMDEDFPSGLSEKLDKVEAPKQRSLLGEK
jgi:hypothetical protein